MLLSRNLLQRPRLAVAAALPTIFASQARTEMLLRSAAAEAALPHYSRHAVAYDVWGCATAGMLLGGSLYAALRKVLFQLTGPGLHGQVCPDVFAGPAFATLPQCCCCPHLTRHIPKHDCFV